MNKSEMICLARVLKWSTESPDENISPAISQCFGDLFGPEIARDIGFEALILEGASEAQIKAMEAYLNADNEDAFDEILAEVLIDKVSREAV